MWQKLVLAIFALLFVACAVANEVAGDAVENHEGFEGENEPIVDVPESDPVAEELVGDRANVDATCDCSSELADLRTQFSRDHDAYVAKVVSQVEEFETTIEANEATIADLRATIAAREAAIAELEASLLASKDASSSCPNTVVEDSSDCEALLKKPAYVWASQVDVAVDFISAKHQIAHAWVSENICPTVSDFSYRMLVCVLETTHQLRDLYAEHVSEHVNNVCMKVTEAVGSHVLPYWQKIQSSNTYKVVCDFNDNYKQLLEQETAADPTLAKYVDELYICTVCVPGTLVALFVCCKLLRCCCCCCGGKKKSNL